MQSNLSLEEKKIYKKERNSYLVNSESCIVRPVVQINSGATLKPRIVDKRYKLPIDINDTNSTMPSIYKKDTGLMGYVREKSIDSQMSNANTHNNNSKNASRIKNELNVKSIETPKLLPDIGKTHTSSQMEYKQIPQPPQINRRTVADLYPENRSSNLIRNTKITPRIGIGGTNVNTNQDTIANELIASLDEELDNAY